MGSRGPQPTPTPILQARGSWRAKLRTGEPVLPVERPACPKWLKGEARSEWNRQCTQLVRMGCLAKIDRAMLAAYCDAWGDAVRLAWRIQETEARRIQAEAENQPLAALGHDELVADLERRKGRAVEKAIKLADRFGFSPAARARLKSVEQEETDAQSEGKARFFAG